MIIFTLNDLDRLEELGNYGVVVDVDLTSNVYGMREPEWNTIPRDLKYECTVDDCESWVSAEYKQWCTTNKLPQVSIDDQLFESPDYEEELSHFHARWHALESCF